MLYSDRVSLDLVGRCTAEHRSHWESRIEFAKSGSNSLSRKVFARKVRRSIGRFAI